MSLVCLQCPYCFQETTCSLAVNMLQLCKQMVSGGVWVEMEELVNTEM